MARFLAVYRAPASAEATAEFESRYAATHLPLVAATPGLTSIEVSPVQRTLVGDPLLLMAVMTFADEDSMRTAMRSPQWQQAGANLAEIGGLELVTMAILGPAQSIRLG